METNDMECTASGSQLPMTNRYGIWLHKHALYELQLNAGKSLWVMYNYSTNGCYHRYLMYSRGYPEMSIGCLLRHSDWKFVAFCPVKSGSQVQPSLQGQTALSKETYLITCSCQKYFINFSSSATNKINLSDHALTWQTIENLMSADGWMFE